MRDWRRYFEPGEDQYVDKVVLHEMSDVVDRALAAGARPPLAYLGAGMTAVVFCDVEGNGFKVGRRASDHVRKMLSEEAEWLATAAKTPGVVEHVARFVDFDVEHVVIRRQCVAGRRGGWSDEAKLFDLHKRIETLMIPRGWTSPEFKGDSYIIREDGVPVLIDASMPSRVGENLLRHAKAVLKGKAPPWAADRLADLAFEIRREVGVTLTREQADPVLRALCEVDPEGCR